MRRFSAGCLAFMLLFSGSVWAESPKSQTQTPQASFACEQARTAIEHIVCQDSAIAQLDQEVAHTYQLLMHRAVDRTQLRREQRAWLKERNQCGDGPCVQDQYQQRLATLKAQLVAVQIQGDRSSHDASFDVGSQVAATPEYDSSTPSTVENVQQETITRDASQPTEMVSDASASESELNGKYGKATPATELEKMQSDALLALALSAVVAFIVLLGMGMTARVVIFYDTRDLMYSISSVISFPILWLVHVMMASVLFNWLSLILAVAVSVFSIVMTFRNAMRHNPPLLGFFVGFCKIWISFLGILVLYCALTRNGNGRRSSLLGSVLMVLGVGWVFKQLVNGERVELLRALRKHGADEQRDDAASAQSETKHRESQQRNTDETGSTDFTQSSKKRPWYQVLGVEENASFSEIKSAYRQKMSQYHPDKTSGLGPELVGLAEKMAAEINEAYDTVVKSRGMA